LILTGRIEEAMEYMTTEKENIICFDIGDKVKFTDEYLKFKKISKERAEKYYGIGKIDSFLSEDETNFIVKVEWSTGTIDNIHCHWLEKSEE
jgi:hypothetical protein